jgi:hypothetical protein
MRAFTRIETSLSYLQHRTTIWVFSQHSVYYRQRSNLDAPFERFLPNRATVVGWEVFIASYSQPKADQFHD